MWHHTSLCRRKIRNFLPLLASLRLWNYWQKNIWKKKLNFERNQMKACFSFPVRRPYIYRGARLCSKNLVKESLIVRNKDNESNWSYLKQKNREHLMKNLKSTLCVMTTKTKKFEQTTKRPEGPLVLFLTHFHNLKMWSRQTGDTILCVFALKNPDIFLFP